MVYLAFAPCCHTQQGLLVSDTSITPNLVSNPNSPTALSSKPAVATADQQVHRVPNNLAHASDIDNIWLLPDGVSDLLSGEAQKQEWLRYELTQLLANRGYELICPPMIEFTESLLGNASEDLKRQTFKIIDQLSGRLMGVRADITPQISRIDAHLTKLGKADAIARYCYAGHVIRTLPNGLFGSRTPLQLGAEIFGCDSLDADLELMDVLYGLLATLDLQKKLHIDIGHVAIFARLKALAGLSANQAAALIRLYANKALPELNSVCATLPMGNDFYQLALYGHDVATLKTTLSASAKNDAVIMAAIDEVQRLVAHIKTTYHGHVSVDITELGYHYHTGIVFNGYFGSESQPVVRGGRFNGQLSASHVGDEQESIATRQATGFSLELTRLQRHITLATPKLVLIDYADWQRMTGVLDSTLGPVNASLKGADDAKATSVDTGANFATLMAALNHQVSALRQLGDRVIRPLSAVDVPHDVTHHLVLQDNHWVLKAVE